MAAKRTNKNLWKVYYRGYEIGAASTLVEARGLAVVFMRNCQTYDERKSNTVLIKKPMAAAHEGWVQYDTSSGLSLTPKTAWKKLGK